MDDQSVTGPAEPPTPADGGSAEVEPYAARVGAVTASLAEAELTPAQRRGLLRRLVPHLNWREAGALLRPSAVVRWVAQTVSDVAPYIPIRDLTTLRRHHADLDGDELAERLIRNAARATGGVGAAGGGAAAVQWVVTPTLLSAPVLLAAETVAVVAIELKLIGELHEVYRVPVQGSAGQRAVALTQAWARQRGVNPLVPGVGAAAILSTAARRELGDRLLRRVGRNLTTLGPLLTGAAAAGYLNRRATLAVGRQVREDLSARGRAITAD